MNDWLDTHPLGEADAVAAAAVKSAVAPGKGVFNGIAGREPFDAIMAAAPVPPGVTLEAATVGEIPGWWARLPRSPQASALIYIHGGWFTWGSAKAFRHVGGHLALAAGVDTFLPDYRLAPEHPFPAATRDIEACYRGLVGLGCDRIAIAGDSAGGNLALVLLSSVASPASRKPTIAPVGAVVFSPITDLTLAGQSYATRGEAEFYFTQAEAAELARNYLGAASPKNALASPLHADLRGLPPVRVHVGDAEVLLDDSRRYVERAVAAGVDAKLDVWMGMPHGFALNIGVFNASKLALEASAAFFTQRFELTADHNQR